MCCLAVLFTACDDIFASEDNPTPAYLSMSDKPVMSGGQPFTGDSTFLFERLDRYKEMMKLPYVTGRDLIEAGLEPADDFSEILSFSHKLRLAGIEKESALKQTLAYARKLRGKNNGKQF